MRWSLLAAIAAAACGGDPSLSVSVQHPDGYGVTQTTITVYAGGGITCAQLEFGDRTEAELAAITVDEVDVTGGGSIDVTRLGDKALVARGYDAQHRFVTAGCQELGEIASGTHVAITTVPAAVVAIDPGQAERPFAERTILVTMTDARGAALDGTVSWQLTGPAGAPVQAPSDGLPTSGGETKIHVNDLGTPGPEGLRLRVPWATAPLPLITAFDLSGALQITLDGAVTTGVHPSCDVRRHAGKPATLVCLTAASTTGHRDAVELAWQTDHYQASAPIALPADNAYAVFVDHDASAADEDTYVISASADGKMGNWYKLGASGSGTSLVFADDLQSVVYIPSCSGTAAVVGITTGAPLLGALTQQEAFYTVAGVRIKPPVLGEIYSGGCVTDVDGNLHQGAMIAGASGDPMLTLFGASPISVPGTRLGGSGFVAVSAGGSVESRFAGTRLQASGTVVFEAVLAPDGSSYKLVERTEVDSAAPPGRIVGGRLDQDGDTDLIWDMTVGARRRIFQVSLAEQVGGAALTAMTSGPMGTPAGTAIDFAVGDLDGDGVDEIVLYTASTVTFYRR
ncbi:MAG TPA: VCBS repeat-containing protein [Kofleriaceae bacterium]